MPTLPLLEADAAEGGEGLPLDLSRSISTSSSKHGGPRSFRLHRAEKLPESMVLEIGEGDRRRRVGLLGTSVRGRGGLVSMGLT